MAGRCAEMEATVGRRGEVRAVAAFAVEANEPAAAGARAYPVPDVGVDHAFKVGGASCAPVGCKNTILLHIGLFEERASACSKAPFARRDTSFGTPQGLDGLASLTYSYLDD